MGIFSVPVTKAGNSTLDIDTDKLPDDMYKLAMAEGLKVLLNKGMSKITTAKLEGEELAKAQAAALAQGEKNAEALRSGTLKVGRGSSKTKGIPGVVMTEARRLAKAVIKDLMRAEKIKISAVPAKEITEAANKLLEVDSSFIAQATANIKARDEAPKPAIDIKSLVKESPDLLAKLADKKAADKASAPLSAKQAGKPVARAKPKPAPQAQA